MASEKQFRELKETVDSIHQMMLSMRAVLGENHQLVMAVGSKLDLFEQNITVNAATKPAKKSRATSKKSKSDEKTDDESTDKPTADKSVDKPTGDKSVDDKPPTKKKTVKKRDLDEPEETEKKSVKLKDDESDEKSEKIPKTKPKKEKDDDKPRQSNKLDVFRAKYKEDPEQFDKYLTDEVKKSAEGEKNKVNIYYKHMTEHHDSVLVDMRNKYNSSD